MYKITYFKLKQWVVKSILTPITFFAWTHGVNAQAEIPLNDLDFFRNAGKSWSIAGDVSAELDQHHSLTTSKGKGILVNIPTEKNQGKDLYTQAEYGDMDLEVEYMMAPGSNSGIYLQGRYEIQLLDSWGVVNPKAGDNGGIYERWDDSKPEGQKGFQGYAPRQNVSRAPGLWQHLIVSFQAPRFDDNGNKTENAKILRVELNGVVIHENVELFGPTRGGMENNEKATGPLRIQGDHGAVAFRNINISSFDKPRPELSDLNYFIYGGRFEDEAGFDSLPPEAEGPSVILTSNLDPKSAQYMIKYTGTLNVKEAGEYTFNLNVPGGYGRVNIDDKKVLSFGRDYRKGSVDLPAGEMNFELLYSKFMDWVEPGLGLAVAGPGIREYQLTNSNAVQSNAVDPILVDPSEKPLLRSFMDLPNSPRVTHAVSVGSEAKVHYTYDMDHGSLFQIWRGEFLNATPMWHNRGDGSSRPMGSVVYLGKPTLSIAKLSSEDDLWVADTTGSSFKPKGYKINDKEEVTFLYEAYGASVEDDISVLANGHGIKREIRIQNIPDNLYVLLAQGNTIEEVKEGMYLVDDKTYYLELAEGKPVIRKVPGQQKLIIPATESLVYTLLF
ncbi:MAG: DUF1080 domain-containing protein [Anditalea sp.]